MRLEKKIVLVLGYCPLKEEVIKEIIKKYLIPFGGYAVVPSRSKCWEVHLNDNPLSEIELTKIEKLIVAEFNRLRALESDLEMLGVKKK